MLKKINGWLISYLVLVLLFSGMYYMIWNARPDSFIINSELNLNPWSDIPLLARQVMAYHPTTGAPNLGDISAKLAGINAEINELYLKIKLLDQKVDSGRSELAEIGRRNETIIMAKGERYRQEITAGASQSVVDAERVLKAFSERGSLEQSHGVAEANLRVKLAEALLIHAEKMAEAYSYFISNMGQFGDPQLIAQIDQLHNKTQAQAREREQAWEHFSQKQTELIGVAHTFREQRLDAVSWVDFLFFSIGISTTTTYGDVVGNSRLVRTLIAAQLLICVFVMAGFVSSVVSRSGRREGDTSISLSPDINGS